MASRSEVLADGQLRRGARRWPPEGGARGELAVAAQHWMNLLL